MKRTTMLLLWLGAAISLSEIYTGGMLAPLGLSRGLGAILIGHLIGVTLLAMGGYISFSRQQNAMASVGYSLGRNGGRLVAFCNVVQLIGWTIIMVVQAGSAVTSVFPGIPFQPVTLALSLLVLIWALFFGRIGRWNDVVVVVLFILCILLLVESGKGVGLADVLGEGMTMTLAIELSITMPISWLPLIGDYTSKATDKTGAVAMPFLGYFLGSVFMYAFGLFVSIKSGGDIFSFIAASQYRLAACGIIVLSTLTTAFLDLYSAAVSARQLVPAAKERTLIVTIGVLAALVSAFFPAELYEELLTAFLMAIGTVFIPVYAVVFVDFFRRRRAETRLFNWQGLIVAVSGMAAYQWFNLQGFWVPTVLTLALVVVLYTLGNRFWTRWQDLEDL